MDSFGETQRSLLQCLQREKLGLTVDQLGQRLGITRTAVRQHLATLERLRYVESGPALSTGGRPGRRYRLSRQGNELFPRQYSLFAQLLLKAILAEKGSEHFEEFLQQLGESVGDELAQRVRSQDLAGRIHETVAVMNELAYQADAVAEEPTEVPAIEASNCVYHALARETPQICRFDLALLARLIGNEVVHEKCIVRGDNVCRFCVRAPG